MKKIFRCNIADEASSDYTVWSFLRLYALTMLWVDCFTDSNHQTQKEPKKEGKRGMYFNGPKPQRQRKVSSSKGVLNHYVREQKNFQHTFSALQKWMSRNVQATLCKNG